MTLISLGSPHVRCTPMGRPCGEPNGIELTPIGGIERHAGGARLPFAFCNDSVPLEARLDDLLTRATCAEKAAAIPRLGVPVSTKSGTNLRAGGYS